MKRGILLAAFGSGSRQGESTLSAFENLVRERFPAVVVRWAFTSPLMRTRLAAVGKKTDSVGKALRKMAFEKFSHVAVQPLYVVSGIEYSEIMEEIDMVRAEGMLAAIRVGAPLLNEAADVPGVGQTLLESLPAERLRDDAVVFMGHGSQHASQKWYFELSQAISRRDSSVFLGTLRGQVGVEHILPRLADLKAKRVWLLPLLAMVGRHALEDMAGEGDSWKTRLERAGFYCLPVLRGLAESPVVARLWLQRLEAAGRDVLGDQITN